MSGGQLRDIQEELHWVNIKDSFNENNKSKMHVIYKVLVPAGVLATAGVLGTGLFYMIKRNAKKQQSFMRYRVLAQGITVLVAALGVLQVLATILVGFVSCQYEHGSGGYQRSNQPPSNILLHKQALGQDGSFNYAFAADNGLQQGEVINPDGSRKGSYSYVDPNGKTVTLSYTAGKDGFRVLNGDHVPKAPEPQQQRPNPQYYQQQPQNQHYSQPPRQEAPQYPLFRPNPVPFEAYRNAPNAPAYRGNPVPYEEPYRQHHQQQYHQQPPQAHYPAPGQYENAYRQPPQVPHHVRPIPQFHPHQYRVQEGNREKPYLAQQFADDYRQEDPRKPHSFGNGYSFEFAG